MNGPEAMVRGRCKECGYPVICVEEEVEDKDLNRLHWGCSNGSRERHRTETIEPGEGRCPEWIKFQFSESPDSNGDEEMRKMFIKWFSEASGKYSCKPISFRSGNIIKTYVEAGKSDGNVAQTFYRALIKTPGGGWRPMPNVERSYSDKRKGYFTCELSWVSFAEHVPELPVRMDHSAADSAGFDDPVMQSVDSNICCASCGTNELFINYTPCSHSGGYIRVTCPHCGNSKVLMCDMS